MLTASWRVARITPIDATHWRVTLTDGATTLAARVFTPPQGSHPPTEAEALARITTRLDQIMAAQAETRLHMAQIVNVEWTA